MKIAGFDKLSLLNYPDKVSATIFTNGCNFLCPYCQNSALVLDVNENEHLSINYELLKLVTQKYLSK